MRRPTATPSTPVKESCLRMKSRENGCGDHRVRPFGNTVLLPESTDESILPQLQIPGFIWWRLPHRGHYRLV
jgi:hypothetical protein